MNNIIPKIMDKDKNIIDSVNILNKFAIYSTFKNDILFNTKQLIFCGGIVKGFNSNVYNYEINDFIVYTSYERTLELELSSNLICKLINTHNHKLISLISYASFALKILRLINPKVGQKIIIFGLNIFSILLYKLISLTGATVFIIKFESDYYKFNDIKNLNIINNHGFDELRESKIDYMLYYSSSVDFQIQCQKNLRYKKCLNLNEIDKFDIGFDDMNYKKGINYPYTYIRWTYKENLKYFISLLCEKKIDLHYFNLKEIDVKNIENIDRYLNEIKQENLILFQIMQ